MPVTIEGLLVKTNLQVAQSAWIEQWNQDVMALTLNILMPLIKAEYSPYYSDELSSEQLSTLFQFVSKNHDARKIENLFPIQPKPLFSQALLDARHLTRTMCRYTLLFHYVCDGFLI